MMAMIIACSLMMAGAMAVVVGSGPRREGLDHWAAALLFNGLGHLLLMLRFQVPDLLSVVLANALLSLVFSGLISAIYQFQARAAPWWALLAPPLLVALLAFALQGSFAARVAAIGLVIGLQGVWGVAVALQQRHGSVGRGLWLLVAGMGLQAGVLLVRAALALGSPGAEVGILHSSGLQTATFLSTLAVVLLSSMGFVFMARDRADETNRVMAAIDPLTGVANRRSLIAALDRDISRALRTRESIALMMVDIDHFKRVNDRWGHPVGDQVLCHVVNVLRERVRAQDLVGRYGGEEFMVVLPDTTLAGAEQLARTLCRAVADSRCPVPEAAQGSRPADPRGIAVTVSIGVFGGRLEGGDSWDMLIAAADRALYQAKENGRNRVEVALDLRRPSSQAAERDNPETHPGY